MNRKIKSCTVNPAVISVPLNRRSEIKRQKVPENRRLKGVYCLITPPKFLLYWFS